VAIVTGASRGIGRNIALALAEAGARVVVAARSEQENPKLPGTIHSVAERIEKAGGRALPVKCDVANEEDVAAMVERTLATFGRIDVLVNNAGVMWLGKVADTPLKRWELVLRINLTGTFLCTRAVLPHLRAQRSGSLVAITTNGVLMTDAKKNGGSNAYWVSKAAIERLYIGLASECLPDNVAVNCLAPSGVVLTEGWEYASGGAKIPPEYVEAPEVMGKAAVFLAAQDASGVTGRVLYSRQLLDEVAGGGTVG
jgi:NAD(P)-dependent dehydrogenase (short-subunit alcohol dehydrogenase family)